MKYLRKFFAFLLTFLTLFNLVFATDSNSNNCIQLNTNIPFIGNKICNSSSDNPQGE
jgi:hypothetical protein